MFPRVDVEHDVVVTEHCGHGDSPPGQGLAQNKDIWVEKMGTAVSFFRVMFNRFHVSHLLIRYAKIDASLTGANRTVVRGEHFASAAEACLHLIDNKENIVLVAQSTDARQIPLRVRVIR